MYMYFYVYMYMCLFLRVSMIYSVCLHTCVCVDHRNNVWEKPLFSDYFCFDIACVYFLYGTRQFHVTVSFWRAEEISYIDHIYIDVTNKRKMLK